MNEPIILQVWMSDNTYLFIGVGIPVPAHQLVQHGRQLLGRHPAAGGG